MPRERWSVRTSTRAISESHECAVPARLVVGQRVCMRAVDVRNNFPHRQRACGNIITENIDIVPDQADGTSSGAMAISVFALELSATQISPLFCANVFLSRLEYRPHPGIGIENGHDPST